MASATSNSPNTLTPREAADALRASAVVLAPTETVYGLSADASSPKALAALWDIGRSPDDSDAQRQPLAWHIASPTPLIELLGRLGRILSPVQNRLVARLCPGPLLLAVELSPGELASAAEHLGVQPGVLNDGQTLLVRIIDNRQSQQAIDASGRPIVMRSVPGAGTPRTLDEAIRALERAGALDRIAGVIASGERPLGKPSTLVRFLSSGGYRVDREGAYAARYIDKQLMRTILFVCTGNTCRSPMAEAIAAYLIEQDPLDLPTSVRSAGAFTSGGLPATPEAVAAVESLGIPMPAHASSVLTREMISQADEIYALSRSHMEAIRSIDAGAGEKLKLLDPSGHDVSDPIGQDQSVYNQTAKRLRELIEQRLEEHRSRAAQEEPSR